MSFNTIGESKSGDKVFTSIVNQIHVDGVNVKVLPNGTPPTVVYRIGDGTVHPDGFDNVLDNEYLDFYVSSGAQGTQGEKGEDGLSAYTQAVAGGYVGTQIEFYALLTETTDNAILAEASAVAAALSELNAANSATASANSATNSETSATNSANSASSASTSATNASNSASSASASATSASNSATSASTSASAATTSATNSANSATASATSASNASTSESNASTSATNAQLEAWIAEAERMTADSYATEAEDVFVKLYTSDGDGTFTATPTTEYSSLHYAAKSLSYVGSAITTIPLLSGASTVVENNDLVITITNYADYSTEAVWDNPITSSGTAVRVGDTITVSAGTVTADEPNNTVSITVNEPSHIDAVSANHVFTVTNVAVQNDTDYEINVSGSGFNATNFPTAESGIVQTVVGEEALRSVGDLGAGKFLYTGNGTSQEIPVGSPIGNEKVTNGTFDTDTSSWTGVGAVIGVSDGKMYFGTGEVSGDYAYQDITTVIGVTYRVSGEILLGTNAGARIYATQVSDDSTLGETSSNVTGSYIFTFVATQTTTRIRTFLQGNGSVSFDNISVKELKTVSSIDFTTVSNGTGYYHDRVAGDGIVKNDAGTPVESGTIAFKDIAGIDGILRVHVKARSIAQSNMVANGVTGSGKYVYADLTAAESGDGTFGIMFNSASGFTVNSAGSNTSGATYVSYIELYTHIKWGLTNQGKRYIEAYNPYSKMGMVLYEGSGVTDHQIPHNAGTVFGAQSTKALNIVSDWPTTFNHTDTTADYALLNSTVAATNYSLFGCTSTYYALNDGSANRNGSGNSYVMYYKAKSDIWTCGTYVGTGAAGNFIETVDGNGNVCKPHELITKRTNDVSSWATQDNKRLAGQVFYLDLSNAEATTGVTTINDNGFTVGGAASWQNVLSSTYFYQADLIPRYYTEAEDGFYWDGESIYQSAQVAKADLDGNWNGTQAGYAISKLPNVLSTSDATTFTSTVSLAAGDVVYLGDGTNFAEFTVLVTGTSHTHGQAFTPTFASTGNNAGVDITFDGVNYNTLVKGTATADASLVAPNTPLDEFETYTYIADGGVVTETLNNITSQLDFAWFKDRDAATSHQIYDSIRGNNRLKSDATDIEASGNVTLGVGSFDLLALGFGNNSTGNKTVAWCASLPTKNPTNTAGTITSNTMANSFMSVFAYIGANGVVSTVAHGLSSKPQLVLFKNRDTIGDWPIYNETITATKSMNLQETSAAYVTSAFFNNTEPTSTVVTVGSNTAINGNATAQIAYAFTSVDGLCKVGSYTGTGVAGNEVYCGFEPAWIMVKRTDGIGNWIIRDNKRFDGTLYADLSNAEDTSYEITHDITGFTLGTIESNINASGGTYIFLAIAKNTPEALVIKENFDASGIVANTGTNLDFKVTHKEVATKTTQIVIPLTEEA